MKEYLSKEKKQEVRSVKVSPSTILYSCAGRGWGQAAGEESRPVGGGLGVGRHGGGASRGRGNVRWTRDTDDTMALSLLNIIT